MLIDFYINNKLTEEAYNMKIEELEQSEQNLKSQIATGEIPKIDFDNCLNYACGILNNLDTFLQDSDIKIKQRLQKIIFPQGLRYETEDFRNTAMSSLFKTIGTLSVPYIDMVLPGEFESPPTP